MKKFPIPKTAIHLALGVLAALILLFINEASYREASAAAERIKQAEQTHQSINTLLQQMLNAETGSRGYLLTGDARYLEPYSESLSQVTNHMRVMRDLFASDAQQLTEFTLLMQSVARKLGEMELSLRMYKEGKEEAWKFVLTTDVGHESMASIRTHSSKLSALSALKTEKAQSQIASALLLARLGITAIALVGLLGFCMYLRQTKTLMNVGLREQASLERERDMLEKQVRERTARLAELATHLQNVREEERGHLARELHDELGALLTAAKLDVARIKSRLADSMPEASERLAHLTEALNSGIALKRRIVEDLRPSSLTHLGLVASLEILTKEFQERTELSISTAFEAVNLSDTAELTIYRLVQESLTNISKYAKATHLQISVQNQADDVVIEVVDDGIGFETHRIRKASHGLSGMRHRVEAAGGHLNVFTAPGKGTRISATLPKTS